MGHEFSASFERDGKELLIPTVDPKTKRKMSMDEAIGAYDRGETKLIGTFNSPAEATAFSKKRSKSFNRPQNPSATGTRITGKDVDRMRRRGK